MLAASYPSSTYCKRQYVCLQLCCSTGTYKSCSERNHLQEFAANANLRLQLCCSTNTASCSDDIHLHDFAAKVSVCLQVCCSTNTGD
jgi:hypothetical protein